MARRTKTTVEKKTAPEADENFGLPDLDYKPLQNIEQKTANETTIETIPPTSASENIQAAPQDIHTPPQQPESYTYNREDESNNSSKIAIIVVIVLLVLGAGWYFGMYKPQKEKEAKELADKKRKEAERIEQERLAEQQRLEEERRRAEELANAQSKEGTIETLNERTGRYYVVAASAVDADLIMDYAKKLSKKGVNTKIIPPYGTSKFSRIAIADADTYSDAQKIADTMKGGDYGDALWVKKY